MKSIECFQTADGIIHRDFHLAKSHADELYGDALTRLAHRLSALEKYSSILKYLDDNTHQLLEIVNLKADMKLDGCSDSDDMSLDW